MKELNGPTLKIAPKKDFSKRESEYDGELSKDNQEHIKQITQFDEEQFLQEVKESGMENTINDFSKENVQGIKQPRKFFKTKLTLAFLGILVFAESFYYIAELIADFDVLDAAWLAFFCIIVSSFFVTVFGEYRSLRTLKNAEEARRRNHYFLNSNAIGNADVYCQKLCSPLEKDYSPAVEKWRCVIKSHHTNKEVTELFDDLVVAEADKKAIGVIRKQSAATAALIGVSPLASVDMMVVFIRHWQMIDQISRAYGLKLGYSARIKLLRQIAKHMMYAGASEILLDASVYALGSSITAKLSTKVAQGVGAGSLTGRLGLQVMAQCRPFEWKSANKPTLTSIASHILNDLRRL